jgi:hypothetical protein
MGRSVPRFGILALILALAALPLLSACNSAPPICPSVLVVGDARQVTKYRSGPGRDITDVAYEAVIGAGGLECTVRRNEIVVDLRVEIGAQRGPAAPGAAGDFGYFVAIADADRNILARQEFTARVEFPPSISRSGVFEELRQRIPIKAGERGDDFTVFVGFTLTEEEIERNRRR